MCFNLKPLHFLDSAEVYITPCLCSAFGDNNITGPLPTQLASLPLLEGMYESHFIQKPDGNDLLRSFLGDNLLTGLLPTELSQTTTLDFL